MTTDPDRQRVARAILTWIAEPGEYLGAVRRMPSAHP
jgi:hypothetical protein